MKTLHGQGVSRGGAFGRLTFFHRSTEGVAKRGVGDIPGELNRFADARNAASAQLDVLYSETVASLGEENALLFQIHQMILEDPDLCATICAIIQDEGVCAEYAVETAARAFAATFSSMEDAYMRSRAADITDVARRLVRVLSGEMDEAPALSEPVILAADDLVPSETARLDRSKVLAFVTAGGCLNSHTAIFARTMGIPAVVGLGDALTADLEGRTTIVDGAAGEVLLDPDSSVLDKYRQKQRAEAERRAEIEQYRGKPSMTRAGQRIKLCANVGSLDDVEAALQNDAEGVGLFRSEFLYLQSDDFPSEEVQFSAYRTVVEQMAGRQVVIRTMDIGADKQAAYFRLSPEENPAMGMRAIRICLTRPEIFTTQMRALYRASAYGTLAVMFPMITHPNEVRRVKQIAAEVREALRSGGIPFDEGMALGIMVETPAAALLSDLLAQEVDFFSVGTNDLTQYTLALDRQNSQVASFDDPAHAAVLRLIATAAENAHKAGIWIGVCGELGADEALTAEFLRMGIDELSVTPSAILRLRAKVAEC